MEESSKENSGLESIIVLSFCPTMMKNGEIITLLSSVGSFNLAREIRKGKGQESVNSTHSRMKGT